MSDLKSLVVAVTAFSFLVLGTANIVGGQFLGAAILLALAGLAATCSFMLVGDHGSHRLDRGRRRYR